MRTVKLKKWGIRQDKLIEAVKSEMTIRFLTILKSEMHEADRDKQEWIIKIANEIMKGE